MRELGELGTVTHLPICHLVETVTVPSFPDAPIVHWNPFHGMAAAMDRQTLAGSCLACDQALTARDALALYTTQAAKALDMGHEVGSISVGKLADLVVVDRDVLACSAEDVRRTQVRLTVVSGRIVHQSQSHSTKED